mgnify:CR=1 FL=1
MATVNGYVEKIKFRNEENGYSILSVNSDGEEYVLVGTFPYISEGDFGTLSWIRRCERCGNGSGGPDCPPV